MIASAGVPGRPKEYSQKPKREVQQVPALNEWENFYVILGSSAGALIGLQFVAITLIADLPARKGQEMAGAAFATPTSIHFSVVLVLATVLSAPWHGVTGAAVLCTLLGLGGII